MNDPSRESSQFIEEMGELLDEQGIPRMAGRVVGALLVRMPPERSLEQLADDLHASMGAVSMATQLLVRMGTIDRLSLPGDRRHYFRIRPGLWKTLFLDRSGQIGRRLAVVRRQLEKMRDEPIEAKRRLIAMEAFFQFILDELPGLSKRWDARRSSLDEDERSG